MYYEIRKLRYKIADMEKRYVSKIKLLEKENELLKEIAKKDIVININNDNKISSS